MLNCIVVAVGGALGAVADLPICPDIRDAQRPVMSLPTAT